MSHFAATHPLLIVGAYFAIAAGLLVLVLCMFKAQGEEPTFVEVEEIPSAWDSLPPKWHPDPAESHLGKTHVGERWRAA
jgi:hypothetical protein